MEENNQKIVMLPPPKIFGGMRLLRLGKIFSNLSIFFTILSSTLLLSTILLPLAYFFIVLIGGILILGLIVLTLGLIFLDPNSPLPKIVDVVFNPNVSEGMLGLTAGLFNSVPYVCFASAGCSILAVIFLAVGKGDKKVGRIVGAVFCAIICAALGGVQLWLL